MLILCAILLLAVTIDPAAIPEVLRRNPCWVLWRSIQKQGKPKPSKVPFHVIRRGKTRIDRHASSTDPTTWGTFECVFEEYLRCPGDWSGLMRAFVAEDGITGIDVDQAYPGGDLAAITPWAREIEQRFADTFRERSVSLSGFHVFCYAQASRSVQCPMLAAGGEEVGQIEVYDRQRFFVVTGDGIAGTPLILADHQKDVESLIATINIIQQRRRERLRPVVERAGPIRWSGSLPDLEVRLLERFGVVGAVRHPRRHSMLLRMLGSLWRHGIPAAVVQQVLEDINRQYCDPPYPATHIAAMVRSAQRWPR